MSNLKLYPLNMCTLLCGIYTLMKWLRKYDLGSYHSTFCFITTIFLFFFQLYCASMNSFSYFSHSESEYNWLHLCKNYGPEMFKNLLYSIHCLVVPQSLKFMTFDFHLLFFSLSHYVASCSLSLFPLLLRHTASFPIFSFAFRCAHITRVLVSGM